MVHIIGVYIPEEKRAVIGLTRIYGIGKAKALSICKQLDIDESWRICDLTNSQLSSIYKLIVKGHCVESDLKRLRYNTINQIIETYSHRGFRHRVGLPLRGQRTHTNGKTQKKLAQKHRKGL